MTGQETIIAAFNSPGTSEIAAVTSYESLFIRDHWHDLTEVPWWFQKSGIADKELAWVRDVTERINLQWLMLRPCFSKEERQNHEYEKRGNSVWRVNTKTGEEERLIEPLPGGSNTYRAEVVPVSVEIGWLG